MTTHYNAFISYRHNERDTLVASALQTQLERFHIPKAIQEKTGVKKINRIFRDQNELELTSDLGKDIDDALENSDFLIVVLSNAYNESKWCLHEIDQFLKTHDHDHIMAVLSEGEPPGIFPDQLLHKTETRTDEAGNPVTVVTDIEPLACDYRMDLKKASRIELPRLVSGMLGCEYDDLVMRNETYRRNRMIAGFSVAGIIGIAAITWLLISNHQISQNYRQSQINESRTIASASLDALREGQRLDAISLALSALPSDNDRPVTAEAEYALAKASLAYQLPYQVLETHKTDLYSDIRIMAPDPENGRLFLIDQNNLVTVMAVDPFERISSFAVSETRENWEPELAHGNLLVLTRHGAEAWSPQGERLWTQTLNYQIPGAIAVSSDEELAAAADLDAVEIMRTSDGQPVASLRLPQSESRYIYDLVWSPDDTYIAVLLRDAKDSSYGLGMFRTEDGTYYALPGEYRKPEAFQFINIDRLAVLECPRDNRTFSTETSRYIQNNPLSVYCFTPDGLLWQTTVPFSMESVRTEVHFNLAGETPIMTVSAADTFSVLDQNTGEILSSQTLGSPILTMYYGRGNSYGFITADGYQATVWAGEDSASMTRLFPESIAQAAMFEGKNMLDSSYAILSKGNVSWYEPAFDPDLSLFQGNGFGTVADGASFNREYLAVKCQNEVILYDRSSMQELKRITCGEQELLYILPVPLSSEILPILHIDITTGSMKVDRHRFEDLSLAGSIPLKRTDYLARAGKYKAIDSYFQERQYSLKNMILTTYYKETPVMAVQDNRLCYFEDSDDLIFHVVDLQEGTEKTVPLSLEPGLQAYTDPNDPDGLVFALSEDGNTGILAVQEGESVFPAFFDPKTGAVRYAKEINLLNILFAETADGSLKAVSSAAGISLLNSKNEVTAEIPYPGATCIALYFHKDRLIAVYDDDTLYQYDRNGNLLGNTMLSASNTDAEKTARVTEGNGQLIVFLQDRIDFVDIDEMPTRSSASADAQVLGYDPETDEIIVYSYDGKAEDTLFYPGTFHHYTTEELIEKGVSELNK
ncbi:MAG: toll/interleukin-1 receptor domain-containing protein [Solobacterium sp.]|nr:toll/interleukin-1 receptor domain-containing protein [Solobacterium sp.]